jgi:hypothetical protein
MFEFITLRTAARLRRLSVIGFCTLNVGTRSIQPRHSLPILTLWRLELHKVRRWLKLGQQDNGSDEMHTLGELMKYLSTPENKVSSSEFQEFWKSLTEEEKDEFRKAELK